MSGKSKKAGRGVVVNWPTPKPTVIKQKMNSMEIDRSGDQELLKDSNLNWNDLNDLNKKLVEETAIVANEMVKLASFKEVKELMSDEDRKKFSNNLKQFSNDYGTFMGKIEEISEKHKDKEGPLVKIDEFVDYNNSAMEYHEAHSNWMTLCMPAVTTMTVIATEAAEGHEAALKTQAQLVPETKEKIEEKEEV